MKIALFHENKNLFDISKCRDNYTHRWLILKKRLKELNIDLIIINNRQKAKNYEILIEVGINKIEHDCKYLIIVESKLIRPEDWNLLEHKKYRKIFCWDDDLIDNNKYFKANYSFMFQENIPKNFSNRKLCCAIAGNKISRNPNELYSKRIEFIKWFEANHLEDFDLYGVYWNQYRFGRNKIGKILNKIKILRKQDYKSYKGTVTSKFNTLINYKFSICYENIKDQRGYITEKIFDSLFAGCIPIYWGAENITAYIPDNCFIDKRKFSNFEKLYSYINNIDEEEYFEYIYNIEKFLKSEKSIPFRSETFAETIITEILMDSSNDYC